MKLLSGNSVAIAGFAVACWLFAASQNSFGDHREESENFRSSTHPVSVVEADVYVNRNRTTMKLKFFAEDLELLQGVEALENGFYDTEELIDATRDHADYLAEKILLRDMQGELIKPRVAEIIDLEAPEGGIPAGRLMEYPIQVVLEYDYPNAPEPEFLTIEQKMVAEGQLLPSEFKVLLKQAGSNAPFVKMMKPSEPETFSFDWDNPVLNQDDSEEDWEKWFAEQREKNLGIESYSSVYSFIYITDYEVRHEILVPLATLATLMEIERAEESFLEVEEQPAAAEMIKQYFSDGNPVTIDGVQVQPVFDRIDFYGLDLRDFAIQAKKRRVSMASGRVGLILSYSTKGRPNQVEVGWDKFNNAIRSVDAVIFIGDQVEKTQFSMFLSDNTFRWQAPEREPLPPITDVKNQEDVSKYYPKKIQVPLYSIIAGLVAIPLLLVGFISSATRLPLLMGAIGCCISVGTLWTTSEIDDPFTEPEPFQMEEEVGGQIFAQLHKNLFRAFDYQSESEIYDSLEKSVAGAELRELYLQINDSLKVKEQGGAVARINDVKVIKGQVEPTNRQPEDDENPIQFDYVSEWTLDGTIEHWGHIHRRETSFTGKFKIELVEDAWKITQMQVVDQTQGVVKTSVRTF